MGYLYGLGYIGFHSADVDGWARFATDVLGAELPGRSERNEPLLIRLDDRAFRLMVSEGPEAFSCAGWEVAGYRELDALLERLSGAGVAVKEEPDLAPLRRVARVASCLDPAGHRLEFFCGALKPKAPLRPARADVRYVSGALGLGHVVFTVSDLAESLYFYLDLLGFKISDIIRGAHFMRVNQRHHSVSFREIPGESRFRHFSLEVENIDMVGRTLDAAERAGTPVSCGLGRHVNDLMVSFYMKTPSGYEVEYGCQGRLIDDATWSTSSYDAASIWGHKRTIPVPS